MEDSIQQEIVKWSSKRFFYQNEMHKKIHHIDLNIVNISEIQEHDLSVSTSIIMTCPSDIKILPFFKNSIHTNIYEIYDIDGIKKIHFDMEVYLHNKTEFIPFNRQYFYLDMVVLDKSEYKINFSVNLDYSLYDRFLRHEHILTEDGFIYEWKCNKYNSYKESVVKYMIIPYSLTILQQLTHSIKKSGKGDLIAVASTFMLGDIALFFTLPATARLTGIEKALFLNLFFKFYVSIIAFYDFDNKISSTNAKSHILVDIVNSIIITLFIIGYYIWLCYSCFRKENNNHGKINHRNKIKSI